MLIIGLIGGIASGKSTVGSLLEGQGAVVLNADQFAHRALAEEPVKRQLIGRWGPEIQGQDGQLIRREIAARVFGDAPQAVHERKFLESLIHPVVRTRLREEIARRRADGTPVVVLDVPLLIEAGWADECDLVLFVDAPHDARLARTADRGWDLDELTQREASQLPIAEKKRRADFVIPNQGGLAELEAEVARLWQTEIQVRTTDPAPPEDGS